MKQTKNCMVVAMLFSTASWAHGPHVHGEAKVNLAVESANKAVLQFISPGDSVFGFEHEAKSAADKKKQSDAIDKVKNKMAEMVLFDKSLNCTLTATKTDIQKEKEDEEDKSAKDKSKKEVHHGEHNELLAEFAVTCAKDMRGSMLNFAIGKVFPRIADVDVAVLADQEQASAEIKKDKGNVLIPKPIVAK